MTWNWQLKGWPNFTWENEKLAQYESTFVFKTGIIWGSSQHIPDEDKQAFERMSISDRTKRKEMFLERN